LAIHVADLKSRLKKAEQGRLAAQRKYRLLAENISEVVTILDPDLTYTYVSPSVKHVRGFDPGELIGKPLSGACTPESIKKAGRLFSREEIVQADSGRDVTRLVELEMFKKDGSTIWSESRVSLLRDASGRHAGYITVSRDVDESRKINAQLRESEEKYRTILENIEEGYYEVDIRGNFTFFNEAICKIAGTSCNEIRGVNFRAYTRVDEAKRLYRIFSGIYKSGKPARAFDLEIFRMDGESRHVEISATLIMDHAGKPTGFRGIMRDITRRKRTEEEKARLEAQLMHAHKMEAVGTLAGGIAHDFNNILQVINGYAQMLLMTKTAQNPDYDKLLQLEKAGERASVLIQQLLTFSRKAGGSYKRVNLNTEIASVEKLLKQTLPKMIDIKINLDERLWPVSADPLHMEQILLNLASNAADAMPDGGQLTIETRNIVLDESYCKAHFEAVPGSYVLLTVSDTGCGMEQDSVCQIFDPFYTTKAIGKGTGLGLASVYGIVKEHGGRIHCYSEPGQGAIFKIYLPAVLNVAADPEKTIKSANSPRGGDETILVVDDEPAVREMAREMLEYFGYGVLCAENGECAIETYRTSPTPINLVLLDLNMPGMGGYKCMKELLNIEPDLKILIASGYSTDFHAEQALSSGAASFIGKPYHLQEMARTVRAALDNDW
jgi:PAS domain S-box-containing protein